jgi:ABC-type sugar transport system permease subunit
LKHVFIPLITLLVTLCVASEGWLRAISIQHFAGGFVVRIGVETLIIDPWIVVRETSGQIFVWLVADHLALFGSMRMSLHQFYDLPWFFGRSASFESNLFPSMI